MDLSIIIPVYNARSVIENCLNSLDLGGHYIYNVEVLVVDDGSQDDTAKVVSVWCAKFPNVKLLQKENGGVSSARNYGIKEAQGKYIFFADADDEVNRKTLDEMIAVAEREKVDLVVADFEKVDILDSQKEYESTLLPPNQQMGRDYIEKTILVRYFNSQNSGLAGMGNKLYLNEILQLHKILFDEQRTHGEDWKFNISYFMLINNVCAVAKSVYTYKLDGSQNYYKYRKGMAYGLLDGFYIHQKLNNDYAHYSKDSKSYIVFMARFAGQSLRYLSLKGCSHKEKKQFLSSKEEKELWSFMLKLNKKDLFIVGYSRRDKFSFLLLRLGHYKKALKLLGLVED